MIFNLNEQKVLSDPSGSSVFKGEKDFNDIVVNLPDNIDGHTATELNYVMHFVDSDGGYSTKILTVDSSGETLKATATVSTNITSKAQAFYAYVLMTDDEETVIGKTNGVIVMIHPVPDEENEIIPPADADKIIKGLEEIVQEATETIETATDTIEEATEAISSKQDKLTAGENITIDEDNVISAEGGGVTSYNDLTDKPQINGVTLSGNKSADNLGLQDKLTAGNTMQIESGIIDVATYSLNLSHFTHLAENNILYSGYDNSNSSLIKFEKAAVIAVTNDDITNSKYSVGANGEIPINKAGTFFNFPIKTDSPPFGKTNSHWVRYYITNDGEIYVGGHGCTLISQYPVPRYAWSTQNYVKILSPSATIVSGVVNANGTITFTDSDGNTFTTTGSSVIGPQGDDYVLTAQDKTDIANIVLSELPTTQGVLYGNQSN